MASTKPHLIAVERARRKKIRELIREARGLARVCRSHTVSQMSPARLLDDLADVAEKYLKDMKDR